MGGCGSDDRAKSVNIDGTVIAEGLIFGLLAGEQVENGGKGLLAYLLDALFAGDDTAGVDVHIVRHPLVGVGVAAHFQDGHGRKALRRAAAGREHHKLCTGGGHAGQDLWLAARRVLDGGADIAQFLNADDTDGFPRLADLSGQPLVVGALAAEAHHQDRCHIGAFA